MTRDVKAEIKDTVEKNKVVLFMKGNATFPQCGFSAKVVEILREYPGAKDMKTVDVLSDGAIREGVKQYANWPTIPQLYVDGKFVGGCDIVTELHNRGELRDLLGG